MRQHITFTVIFIIVLSLVITGQPLANTTSNTKAKGKKVELPAGSEAAKAIARFGDLSPAAIREQIRQMRPPSYLPDEGFINKVVRHYNLKVASKERTSRLTAVLKPVLTYHRRERMPIIVVESENLQANLIDCMVIIITTKMMSITNDEELRGIIAHELAHEYIWDEHVKARQEKNDKLMWECELFCDVVAAFTLMEIGDQPSSYARILERMELLGAAAGKAAGQASDTHPSLSIRKKLNKFLCQQFD